jgi:hypothetical protein
MSAALQQALRLAPNPFGSLSMIEVVDRMGTYASKNNFTWNAATVAFGVFMNKAGFTSNDKKKSILSALNKHADAVPSSTTLCYGYFEHSFTKTVRDPVTDISVVQAQSNMRGGIVVSGHTALCAFFFAVLSGAHKIKDFDPKSMGIYWEQHHPAPTTVLRIIPYLDIDMKHVDDGSGTPPPFSALYEQVMLVVSAASAKFAALLPDGTDLVAALRVTTFYGRRGMKDSLHIHWPALLIQSTAALASIIQELKGDIFSDTSPYKDMVDVGVYSNQRQLLRLPGCGKKGDNTAALRPIKCEIGAIDGEWSFEFIPLTVGHVSDSCTHSAVAQGFFVLDAPSGPLVNLTPVVAAANNVRLPGWETWAKPFMGFWKPIIVNILIPLFMERRRAQIASLNVAIPFPAADTERVLSISREDRYPCSWRVVVADDHFCEFDTRDATPYRHSMLNNDPSTVGVSIIIDLYEGKMAACCSKCRHQKTWFHFIRSGHCDFALMTAGHLMADNILWRTSQNRDVEAYNLLLKYTADEVVFVKDVEAIFVFDNETGIWVTGNGGNRLFISLADRVNLAYTAYRETCSMIKLEVVMAKYVESNPELDEEEIEAKRNKEMATMRKANSSTVPIIPLNRDRAVLLKQCQNTYNVPTKRASMEPFPSLVPLKNKKCVDLAATHWPTIIDILPAHYFTSILNGSVIDLNDETCDAFRLWQLQICGYDESYQQWKFEILGLSLTMHNFDRKFYVGLGPKGRNGKGSECALMEIVTAKASPNRGYTFSHEYLTAGAKAKVGANAPDSVALDMANKTVWMADEQRRVQMCESSIKKCVSGDTNNARQLYSDLRVQQTLKGTLWIYSNWPLIIDLTDNGVVSRLLYMPYDTRWVDHVSEPTKVHTRTHTHTLTHTHTHTHRW